MRQRLAQEIQESSDTLLEQVLDFILFLKTCKNQDNDSNKFTSVNLESTGSNQPPIWSLFEAAAESLSEEDLDELPIDGSKQHDHYLYGTPKREL
ncbi:hypothetical protein [Gloeocapsa sp. PCC 73106]|uniref:hypothetical protein n=1 Tax=Gloeocapsa sp. PCC 73106 TaxID=102232 RepID=UPI00130E2412|nr:hypothetical protein [Gloeocapsa sp. PCC 73106]